LKQKIIKQKKRLLIQYVLSLFLPVFFTMFCLQVLNLISALKTTDYIFLKGSGM